MATVAVIIPCYNEAVTIGKVVRDFQVALPHAEIWVCDNNSTDGTAMTADEAGAHVIHEAQPGKGHAVRRLFNEVDADCYLMVDGDDTYPADAAEQLIAPILTGEAHMTVGNRLSATYFSSSEKPMHKLGNRLTGALLRLHGCTVTDPLSGMRGFSRKFVTAFDVACTGFELETELCIFAAKHDFPVVSIPIAYGTRPEGSVSKLSTLRDGIRVLATIAKRFFV